MCLIHTQEAPSGKEGNSSQGHLSFSPMQTEEQGIVLTDKNQRKKGSVEKRFCFCFAFGAKINLFPHRASWIYQVVVNTASRREEKVGRQRVRPDGLRFLPPVMTEEQKLQTQCIPGNTQGTPADKSFLSPQLHLNPATSVTWSKPPHGPWSDHHCPLTGLLLVFHRKAQWSFKNANQTKVLPSLQPSKDFLWP